MRSPLDSIDTSIGTMDFGERGRSVRGAGGTGTTVGAPLNTSVQDIEDQVRYTVNIPKDDGGSEARQLTRKQIESSVLGMTDSNPFGAMSGIARLLGPKNISYPDLIGTPAFGAVKNLMFRRYLSPVDPRTGRVEPGLGVGDPTRYGTVERDPSLRKTGSESLFPGAGIIAALFDRSDLTVPGFTGGQILESVPVVEPPAVPVAAPPVPVAAPPVNTSAAEPSAISDVFIPFTTDPEVRNLIEEDFKTDRRATAEDSPVSRGTVREIVPREIFADDITIADVIANTQTVATSPVVPENKIVQNPVAPAPVPRESILGPATDRLRGTVDKLMNTLERVAAQQDAYEELYPSPKSLDQVLSSSVLQAPANNNNTGDPIDLYDLFPQLRR